MAGREGIMSLSVRDCRRKLAALDQPEYPLNHDLQSMLHFESLLADLSATSYFAPG